MRERKGDMKEGKFDEKIKKNGGNYIKPACRICSFKNRQKQYIFLVISHRMHRLTSRKITQTKRSREKLAKRRKKS